MISWLLGTPGRLYVVATNNHATMDVDKADELKG
jgi:hypothetical protein